MTERDELAQVITDHHSGNDIQPFPYDYELADYILSKGFRKHPLDHAGCESRAARLTHEEKSLKAKLELERERSRMLDATARANAAERDDALTRLQAVRAVAKELRRSWPGWADRIDAAASGIDPDLPQVPPAVIIATFDEEATGETEPVPLTLHDDGNWYYLSGSSYYRPEKIRDWKHAEVTEAAE